MSRYLKLKTIKAISIGLVFSILTACSSNPDKRTQYTKEWSTTSYPDDIPSYNLPEENEEETPINTIPSSSSNSQSSYSSTGAGNTSSSSGSSSSGNTGSSGNVIIGVPLVCRLERSGGYFWPSQEIQWRIKTNTGENLIVDNIVLSTPWYFARLRYLSSAIGITFFTSGPVWLQFYLRSAHIPNRPCNLGQPLIDRVFINQTILFF